MGLKDDAKAVIGEMLGSAVAAQVDGFEDPDKYPEEFAEECIFFLGRMVGDEIARKKFEPVMRKYLKQESAGGKHTDVPPRRRNSRKYINHAAQMICTPGSIVSVYTWQKK